MKTINFDFFGLQVKHCVSPYTDDELYHLAGLYYHNPAGEKSRSIAMKALMNHWEYFWRKCSDHVDLQHGCSVGIDYLTAISCLDENPMDEKAMKLLKNFFYIEEIPDGTFIMTDIGKATLDIWMNETVQVKV